MTEDLDQIAIILENGPFPGTAADGAYEPPLDAGGVLDRSANIVQNCDMVLTRYYGDDKGTAGVLNIYSGPLIAASIRTLELPWKQNRRQVSCIPDGVYKCRLRQSSESQKFNYEHVYIMDVPGRDFIMVHRANWAFQVSGCVAVGMSIARSQRYPGHLELQRSTEAMDLLVSTIKRSGMNNDGVFSLGIVSGPGIAATLSF